MTNDALTDLIENFSPEKLTTFFRSYKRLRDFTPIKERLSHLDGVDFTQIEKLGELKFSSNEQLIVCAIKVTKDLTERSGKKAQFDLAKKILGYYEALFDGIFVFYDDEGNFRFSLIYANYYGTRRSFSNYRRFTYFVTRNSTNKTFKLRMSEGDFSSLEGIKEAFSVEKVTKEFYSDISNWFDWALKTVKYPEGAKVAEKGYEMSVIRLITRMIFVWFMRVKGFISKDLFDQETVRFMISEFDEPGSSSYYHAIIQNLFFATLSKEVDKRELRNDPGFKNRQKDYGKDGVFRFKTLFFNQDNISHLFKDIPFLNGGLFSCLDIRKNPEKGIYEEVFIDGFSDNPKNQASVPNELFFGDDSGIDLNECYGTRNQTYTVRGLIKTFERFNFTIDENTPDDQDVALDPELLGQVFENLLARINPETSETARKETGSFYTPREIVDFMVDESLLTFLQTYLSGIMPEAQKLEPRLRALLSYHDEVPDFSEEETGCLIEAIDQLKILDPACGSGAFPMGMLNKLVYLLSRLDPANERWRKVQLNKAIAAIEKASTKKDEQAKRLRIQEIENAFDRRVDSDYGRKLYLIRNSIFGVDVQPMAVHIAKLRFFISLIVEQKMDKNKPEANFGILPLPNLETKFVAANSLLHLYSKPSQIIPRPVIELSEDTKNDLEEIKNKFRIYQNTSNAYMRDQIKTEAIRISHQVNSALRASPDYTPLDIGKAFDSVKTMEELKRLLPSEEENKQQMSFLESEENPVSILKEELTQIHEQHFSATDPKKKDDLEKLDAEKRQELSQELSKQTKEWSGGADKRAALLAAWNPYDQNSVARFFDPEWMFDVKDGFDIVIGNPPYIQLQSMRTSAPVLQQAYANAGYKVHDSMGDIYCLFYEMGYSLLRWRTGILAYITSNKWMRAGYGKKLRDFFNQYTDPIKLIDFAGTRVFTTATVDVNIMIFRKSKTGVPTQAATIKENCINVLSDYLEQHYESIQFRSGESWVIVNDIERGIREKIEAIGTPLAEWDVKIYRGILTGLNEAFIISGAKKDELIKKDPRSAEIIRPILRGRDIKRYGYTFADKWLISTFPSKHYDIDVYPAVRDFLLSFGKEKLEQSGRKNIGGIPGNDARKRTNNKWFETQDSIAYSEEFDKQIIVWKAVGKNMTFALWGFQKYVSAPGAFISSEKYNKYLLAFLQSNYGKYFFYKYSDRTGAGDIMLNIQSVEKLLVPKPSSVEKESIDYVITQILLLLNSPNVTNDSEKNKQVNKLEVQLNQYIYSMFNFSDLERLFIESSTTPISGV